MDRESGPKPSPTGEAAPVRPSSDQPVPTRPIISGLAADPRVPVWIRRAVIALVLGILITIFGNWRWGLTAAAAAAIMDTIYQSKQMAVIPAAARVTSAQRKTRHRLFLLRPNGYLSVNARAIPGTDSVIDHLVIGPGGVFAVDSERWDRRLPIRTGAVTAKAGPVLYHGPFSQKDRLAHARWEAAQASRLLGADLGREVSVYPAMVIYGPKIPWTVANLRGVDVFSGRAIGKYFRGRTKAARSGRTTTRLTWEEATEIFNSAQRTLPLA